LPQINDIRELAQQNARYVSNSPQDWMSYLDVAARLYRYSFTDTLLIHAQRPDATACAELELWNQKMSRWVNRGAKGIALLDDSGAEKDWNLWGKLNVHPKSFRSVTLKMRFFKHLKRNSPCLMSSMEIFKRKNKD